LDIISLAGKRTALAKDVAKEKLRTGVPLVNREVEQNLRSKVTELCRKEQSDPVFALRLLNELIMESIRKQESHIEPAKPVSAYHIFVKAKELERAGREVLHLEVGEPDFGPPDAVAESLTRSVKNGHAGYTESAGIHELRAKLANQVNQKYDLDISATQVTVTVGGRFALYLSLVASIRPGDEVIVIDPSYPAYSDCIRETGGRPIHLPTRLENNWIPDSGLLEDNINQTTRMIILNSPSNPTGKVLDKSTLDMIVELAVENDIRIVSDEVYSEYASSPHTSMLQYPQCDLVYIDSFSKTYGMTGFRLGYAISDVDTIQRITQFQTLSLTCVPEFIQYSGISALDCGKDADHYAALIEKRRTTFCKKLEKMPVSFLQPDGGFYIFPMLNNEDLNGLRFADKLLTEKGVAVVPGIAYGQEYSRFFRISVCQPEEQLIAAANRIEEALG
jgi:aspartate aminotransferase